MVERPRRVWVRGTWRDPEAIGHAAGVSDDELLALESAYRASGSVEDHARWIAGKVRAGRTSRARVLLAAQLGHVAASAALNGVEPVPVGEVVGPIELALAMGANRPVVLVADGTLDAREALLRIVRAVVRLTLERATPVPPGVTALAARLRGWYDCPCQPCRKALAEAERSRVRLDRAAVRALFPPVDEHIEALLDDAQASFTERRVMGLGTRQDPYDPYDLDPVGLWLYSGVVAQQRLLGSILGTHTGASLVALVGAALVARGLGIPFPQRAQVLEALAGPSALRETLVADLGPWLLGEEP